ncbi:MAG: AEC family transporter [Desulfobacteraceae bacterium]
MELIIPTFESVALLLGLGMLGFWMLSRRILFGEAIGFLSTLALDIALPCLVFVNIVLQFQPEDFPGWWQLPLWWLGFTVFTGSMTGLSMLAAKTGLRREFGITLFFQNGLFFPLAILTGMYGSDSPYIVHLFFFMLLFPTLFFSASHFFFGSQVKKLDWAKIVNRVLIATILATVIRLTGVHHYVPGFLIVGLKMIGNMALPVLMIILGGNIYIDFQNKGNLYVGEITKFLIVKNVLFPLACLFLLLLVRPPYHIALLMILQSAVPPITAVPLFVERFGGNRNLVNQFVFTSFILSLITIPFAIYLFGCFFA